MVSLTFCSYSPSAAATESDADSANNIFIEDARLTEGTALRFTVESSYTEILDAGYVPKLTATTLTADNTTSTKALASAAIVGVVATAGAIGMAVSIAKTAESMARQPEAAGKINSAMMLGLVFIETAIIYALIIAILIIFVL